jgi:hypothetical protein
MASYATIPNVMRLLKNSFSKISVVTDIQYSTERFDYKPEKRDIPYIANFDLLLKVLYLETFTYGREIRCIMKPFEPVKAFGFSHLIDAAAAAITNRNSNFTIYIDNHDNDVSFTVHHKNAVIDVNSNAELMFDCSEKIKNMLHGRNYIEHSAAVSCNFVESFRDIAYYENEYFKECELIEEQMYRYKRSKLPASSCMCKKEIDMWKWASMYDGYDNRMKMLEDRKFYAEEDIQKILSCCRYCMEKILRTLDSQFVKEEEFHPCDVNESQPDLTGLMEAKERVVKCLAK